MALLRRYKEGSNISILKTEYHRPHKDENGKRDKYRKFSKRMYEWSKDECERKQLITAIYLYVYLNRERGEQTDEIDRR